MDFFQIFVLAFIQGFTEFLPISSSAHLILVPQMTGWSDQGLAFDIAVHVGSLLAVISYFRKEIVVMFQAFIKSILGKQTSEGYLAWAVLLGTIPVGIAGLLFKGSIETILRSPLVIAAATIIFGIVLFWADLYGRKLAELKNEYQLKLKDIFIIGLAQALALIPGTSRSGITITAGLFLGFSREAAARYSFLLSIPVILLAGGLEVRDLVTEEHIVDWFSLLLGVIVSGISAFICIHFFLKFIQTIGMMPFMIYRVVLGVVLFIIFWP